MAATAGIAFAVVLMLMQLGFQDALLSSAGLHYQHMSCDVALVSAQYEFLLNLEGFPERRLYQALSVDGVTSVEPVYLAQAQWKSPWTRRERTVLVIGFDPRPGYFDLDPRWDPINTLRIGDNVFFDSRSRPEFGPIGPELMAGHRLDSEIAGHHVQVAGLFQVGTSFGVDGTVLMSDRNFFRLAPYRNQNAVNIGLIKIKPGYDAQKIRDQIAAILPADVKVLTHEQLVDLERHYWSTNTPIGFVFQLGLAMGFMVGAIVVYQILYSDVTDHLDEYATLKAMGYRDGFLFKVVIQESVILSVFGFIPGLLVSLVLYKFASDATLLPIKMTVVRVFAVYLMTAFMCVVSGALAMRKLQKADPADIF
jgi:putative ABC transport system permease protein